MSDMTIMPEKVYVGKTMTGASSMKVKSWAEIRMHELNPTRNPRIDAEATRANASYR